MANKSLQTLKFPGLNDTYTVPQVDGTLTQAGSAADAKKTGDEISGLKEDLNAVLTTIGSISDLSQYGDNIGEILQYILDQIAEPVDPLAIDIVLCMGQSNMDGRGTASEAPTVVSGTAYKWDATNQQTVAFEAEGSLIPAFVKTYYEKNSVPIVEVKKAIGGVNISTYISNYLTDACTQLSNCITYLTGQGKHVRRVFALWNQGENDADDGTTTANYEASFAQVKSAVMTAGAEQIFIIDIGQTKDNSVDFTNIRTALDNVCNGTDVVMVSEKFVNATLYMQDQWHYTQLVYNVVGEDSADNVSRFFKGQSPVLVPFNMADVDGEPETYGTLDDWNYEIKDTLVILQSYKGSDADVTVHKYMKKDGMYYLTRLREASSDATASQACFNGNTTIVNLTFEDGIRYINTSNYSDANNVQTAMNMFTGMSNLESITNMPTASAGCKGAFKDTAKLLTVDTSKLGGNMQDCFNGSGVTELGNMSGIGTSIMNAFRACADLVSVGDIDGTYGQANYAFFNDANLESVGALKSTSLTTMPYAFFGCAKLKGTVRIESANVSNMGHAFDNCDLTQITFEVPANSTTYTTLTTAYPSANITTF